MGMPRHLSGSARLRSIRRLTTFMAVWVLAFSVSPFIRCPISTAEKMSPVPWNATGISS